MLMLSCIQPFVTPWTVVCQGFPKQKYWSGLPFPPLRDLPHPGLEPASPESSALSGRFFTPEPPGKPIDLLRGCSEIMEGTQQIVAMTRAGTAWSTYVSSLIYPASI